LNVCTTEVIRRQILWEISLYYARLY